MYVRHWTAAWLKRERYALYKKLPWSFGEGQPLPVTAPDGPKNCVAAKKLDRAILRRIGPRSNIRYQQHLDNASL
jgi:hypothetical protein